MGASVERESLTVTHVRISGEQMAQLFFRANVLQRIVCDMCEERSSLAAMLISAVDYPAFGGLYILEMNPLRSGVVQRVQKDCAGVELMTR